MYGTPDRWIGTLSEALGTSRCFVGLITESYVADLRNGNRQLVRELEQSREYNLHCILIIFDNVSEKDKEYVKQRYKDHRILKIYEGVPKKTFQHWLLKNKAELEHMFKTLTPP